jgi:uncharacterized phage protein (TIGR01671 family)
VEKGMNNLKFRAYDKKSKKMFAVHELNFQENDGLAGVVTLIRGYNSKGCTQFEGKDVFGSYNVKRFELMQFTELKDDSGKEIYQDDIVEIQNKNETKTSYISRVRFGYDGAMVSAHPAHIKMGLGSNRRLSEFCDYGFGGKDDVSCKVIGNIYENSDLIES